jgi:DNA-binding NarL/FixJ family response regulator
MRCLIIDDNADFVDASRGLLDCQGVSVMGVASTSEEALRHFEVLRPDVTLVDFDLEDESGLELAVQLHRAGGPESVTGDSDLDPRRPSSCPSRR